jgi:hypothetical protein
MLGMFPTETPDTLIGSYNKFRHYLRSPYSALLRRFQIALIESDTLVVSGYGFGDVGINSTIINWMTGSLPRRVLLIHKEPELLLEHARMAIQNWWHRWIAQAHLLTIPKWVEEVTWPEIAELLD